VSTLCILDDGTLISGGGSDIKAWDSMNHYKFVKERSVGLHSISVDEQDFEKKRKKTVTWNENLVSTTDIRNKGNNGY
jgi:hypothetical protein